MFGVSVNKLCECNINPEVVTEDLFSYVQTEMLTVVALLFGILSCIFF